MPRFLVGNGAESLTVILIRGNERLTVTADEVWRQFQAGRIAVECVRCARCTRSYPAGCKGRV